LSQVAVYEKGALVATVAAGTLGVADPRPVTPDTLFNVFSVTKGVAAAAILMLVQQVRPQPVLTAPRVFQVVWLAGT
jgi:CubicO group peptidase (beta-lactamase class C family)